MVSGLLVKMSTLCQITSILFPVLLFIINWSANYAVISFFFWTNLTKSTRDNSRFKKNSKWHPVFWLRCSLHVKSLINLILSPCIFTIQKRCKQLYDDIVYYGKIWKKHLVVKLLLICSMRCFTNCRILMIVIFISATIYWS